MKVSLLTLAILSVMVPNPVAGSPREPDGGLVVRNESPKDDKKDDRPYSEGLKAVEQDGKWGFINQDGELVIPYKYHYVRSFRDGLEIGRASCRERV